MIQGIGALSIVLTMSCSTCYHLYNAMSEYYSNLLLRIDTMGIGMMVFTLNLVAVYTSFYAYPLARNNVMATIILICLCNLII